MQTLKTAHLNNLIGEQDGEGQNGPIRIYKGTKANLAKVEAHRNQASLEALVCSGTVTKSELVDSGDRDYWGNPVRPIRREWQVEIGCGALLETVSGLCHDCLGRKTIDPRLVRLREFIALNRHLTAPVVDAVADYTVEDNESIRYPDQEPGPELLKGLSLDSFTYVEKERRLDLEWGGAGENWEGKAWEVFQALGLPHGPGLPGYQNLAGLVAKTSWRIAQADPNRLNLVADLESYLWTGLLERAEKGISWEVVELEVAGAYREWYAQHNKLKVLSSDAHGNAISLDRKAYAESDGGEEWLANDYDQRLNNWEQVNGSWVNHNDWQSYVEAQIAVDYLLQALPEDIREIVVLKASGVNPTKTQRTKLHYFLKGGPTKRRTSPDGRNTETPANAFQVQLILEGGLPAGHGIVSWHKPASRK